MGLEPAELARWTRFAAKGGIGRCIATCDCVAESADDLMFLKDDEITVLLQLPDREGFYLGYCEGVVGRFSGADVRFLGKLKKPVMTKRVSSHSSSTTQSGSHSPSWQTQTHRQSTNASPGDTLNASRSTNSPSDSIHLSFSHSSPTSSANTSQSSTHIPLSPPPKTQTLLAMSSITASSSSVSAQSFSASSTAPAIGGRSVSGSVGASASASSSVQIMGRTRTGSLERTGSPSSGGLSYGQGQRYLASPLSASSVLMEDGDEEHRKGSTSGSGSEWYLEDAGSYENNFATLHERALAEVEGNDEPRFLASGTPLTASPREATFATRAGEVSQDMPTRENSPPSRVHSPLQHATLPSTLSRTASPAVHPQSRTSSPAIQQLHQSGTSSPAYHNSRTASPATHQQYSSSPVATPPIVQPSAISSPGSASFVSTLSPTSTHEDTLSPAPTIESTLTALTSPPLTSRSLPGSSQPRYTALAPAALTLSPTSQSQSLISPLRINKRSPGPGATGTLNGVVPAQRSPPPTGALPIVPGSPPASARDWTQGQLQGNPGQTLILPHSPFARDFAPPHSARSFGTAPSSASVYSAPSMYSEASSPVGRDPSPGIGPHISEEQVPAPASLGPSPPSLSLAPSPYSDPAGSRSPAPSPLSPSSPSHTATFAHRLGLASPASDPFEGREGWREGSGGTVGSSPATLGESGVDELGDNDRTLLIAQDALLEADVEAKVNGDVAKAQEVDHAQAQRAGVSIGLSLLEGLIGTYSDSEDESGSEYGDNHSNNNTSKRATYLGQGSHVVANRNSIAESEDGTVEGLGYARSEDDHSLVATSFVPVPPPPPPPPPQPIQQNEAIQSQIPDQHLSPTTSPTSPGFPNHVFPERSSPNGYASSLRHPRAADARSARSVRSDTLSSWEGDIYDNYRYSRAEGSVWSGVSGTGGAESIRSGGRADSVRSFGIAPFAHAERRPSFDSIRSGGIGALRERGDSGAGRKLDGLVESGDEEEGSASGSAEGGRGSGSGGDQSSATTDVNSVSTPPTDSETPGLRISNHHQRTRSVDSDASVYTQNSRLSTVSRDLAMGGVLAGLGSGLGGEPDAAGHSPAEENGGQGRRNSQGHKPSPLNLQKSTEPLLNTSWGSPMSSPTLSSAGLGPYTPFAGVMDNQGRSGWVPGNDMLKNVDEAPRSPNTMAGFASAMRMRIEEDRAQQQETNVLEDSDSHGLGGRIVVEDDEELPSRIMNSTFDSQAETEASLDHHSADHSNASHTTSATVLEGGISDRINSSPSPELQIQTHLAPLVVANRTPTPEGENDPPRVALLPDTQPPLLPNTSFSPPPDPAQPTLSAPVLTASNNVTSTPSHLRPSLAELRAPGGAPLPGTNQRRSLFLPHPGAPKAPEGLASPGPRYITAQGQELPGPTPIMGQPVQQRPGPMHPGQLPSQPARANVFAAIRMALAMAGRPPSAGPGPGQGPGPRQLPKGPTIYGRIEGDLASALGPIPITFGIEAPKATAPPPGQVRTSSTGPHGHTHSHGHGKNSISGSAAQVKTKGSQAGAPPTPRMQMMSKGGGAIRSLSLGPGVGSAPSRLNLSASVPLPGAASNEQDKVRTEGEKTLAAPIPRANFFPKAAGMRPRSRSFSGFNSGAAKEVPLPKRSREDTEVVSLKDVQRALSPTSPPLSSTSKNMSPSISSSSSLSGSIIGTSSSIATTPASSPLTATLTGPIVQKPGQVSAPSRPSPLSLSHVHSSTPSLKPSISSPTLKPPSSPLVQSVISTDAERSDARNNAVPSTASNDGATSADAKSLQRRSTAPDERASLSQSMRIKTVRSTTLDAPPSVATPGQTASLLTMPHRGLSQELKSAHSMLDLHTASRTSTSDNNDSRLQVNLSPPAIGRQSSLRSKLSLPNLRRKQSRADDDYVTTPTSPTAPNVPGQLAGFSLPSASMHDPEMLQVKDIEFELVRPNLAHHFSQAARTSEDSNVLGRDTSFDVRQDASSFLRAESPAMSVSSSMQQGAEGSLTQQTLGSTSSSSPGPMAPIPPPPPVLAGEASVEAHRARELKWMSLMSSSPASQARKSKKIRRLLVEGVPSSVRYLVWTYLTDGKARFVQGVYSQLCSRGRVAAAGRIEEDVRVGFVGQGEEHLQGTKGGVLSLLSAYLNMVPDVQYSMGLTLIVGQLLLLAPEEDGFWIFVSIMDTHVRPYFSASTTQMDVDASLFGRALENNDPQMAKKLFVDMSILPSAICTPWFSSLFVGTLSPEHLNRIWDLFLFEGIPFLLRVGVALLQCCRRVILEMTSDITVLRILRHPPVSLLPPSPDAFLALVFAVKLKDDDVRKQRVKMEAQVKRQTQAPRTASTAGVGMISLPRT